MGGQFIRYRRICHVYWPRTAGGDAIVVAFSSPEGFVYLERGDVVETFSSRTKDAALGKLIKLQMSRCIIVPASRAPSTKNWPALRASGCKSSRAFGQEYILFEVEGEDESNETWRLQSPELLEDDTGGPFGGRNLSTSTSLSPAARRWGRHSDEEGRGVRISATVQHRTEPAVVGETLRRVHATFVKLEQILAFEDSAQSSGTKRRRR